MEIQYRQIGLIRSPFQDPAGMPIQPNSARGVEGTVVIEEALAPGLRDLDGFSHIILLYHFHLSRGVELLVKPFLDDQERGLFATRAPRRPNSIGLSIVELLEVRGNILRIANVDVLDRTPLLDIKPYVSYFDQPEATRLGWLAGAAEKSKTKQSDDRFSA